MTLDEYLRLMYRPSGQLGLGFSAHYPQDYYPPEVANDSEGSLWGALSGMNNTLDAYNALFQRAFGQNLPTMNTPGTRDINSIDAQQMLDRSFLPVQRQM